MRALQDMRITRDRAAGHDADAVAISALHKRFEAQKRAFAAQPYPSLQERQAHLGALAGMMMANRKRIRKALSDDFAVHPELFTDLARGVFVRGEQDLVNAFYPPYGDALKAITDLAFGQAPTK